MKGEIIGQDGDGIGVSVTDEQGVEHTISVGFDGEIQGHGQAGYADSPSERSVQENEYVNQSQRFARFYVYRETGHETVESIRNPDRIATAATAIASLSDDQFESLFGGLYAQLTDDEAAPVATPGTPFQTRVEQDIYLGMNESKATAIVEQLESDGVLDVLESTATQGSTGGLLGKVQHSFETEDIDASEAAATFGEEVIEAVGPIAVCWSEGSNTGKVVGGADDSLPNRDPDVRIQVFESAYEFDDIKAFRRSLVRHLLCQIRDCYITMGIAPPPDVRIQGPGFYDAIGWYSNHDVYPDYHEPSATIDDWREAHTPEDLLI